MNVIYERLCRPGIRLEKRILVYFCTVFKDSKGKNNECMRFIRPLSANDPFEKHYVS